MKNSSLYGSLIVSLLIGFGLLIACDSQEKSQTIAQEPAKEAALNQTKEEPTVKAKENVEEVAVMETSVGTMVLRFFPEVAPGHVENFKKLARQGFYDGTRFHRVIAGFMIQGGDPNSKSDDISSWGSGSPGYSIKAEFNNKPHVKGTLSMARSSDPNSAGSQFFICHGRAASLDGQYTAFGELLDGVDVLDKIATAPVTRHGGENSLPVSPVTIKSVKIVPLSEYKKLA
jgi:peptidyl-prolyl cis-trans isomerase B (cyclophilin B)